MIYFKLVRDKIPELIQSEGKEAVFEKLEGVQYRKFLYAKLKEEMNEFLESEETEELADLVEVIYAVLDDMGLSLSEFEKLRNEKKEKRGAFNEKLLLKEILDN